MTINLEQAIERFDKAFPNGLLDGMHDTFVTEEVQDFIRIEIDKAFALGTLNGLDKAIELMPEEIPYEKGSEFIGEYDYTKCDVNDSFNSCRSQILSKIKEERKKL